MNIVTGLTEVKSELSSLKNCFQNAQQHAISKQKFEKFSGETPPQTTSLPPQHLRRLDRRALGAPHLVLSALGFMHPVFSVPIVGNPTNIVIAKVTTKLYCCSDGFVLFTY